MAESMIFEYRDFDPVIEAEMSTLSAMFLSPRAAREAFRILRPEMFHVHAHRLIFEAMQGLDSDGVPIDGKTLPDRLTLLKTLDECGGLDYLFNVAESAPSAANVKYYANNVKREWVNRELFARCKSIVLDLKKGQEGRESALQTASTMLQGLIETSTVEYSPDDIFEAMKTQKLMGHKSWIQGLNEATKDTYKGWPCSEYTLIGADTGQGKTFILCQSVGHSIFDEGRRVAIISLEMSGARLWRRISRQRSGFWSEANASYVGGLEGAQEWRRWEDEALASDWLVYDTSKFRGEADPNSIEAIERWVLEKHEIRPIDEVYIDYAGLITTKYPGKDFEKYKHIARRLSWLAQSIEKPIILLGQAEEHQGAKKGQTVWKFRGSQEWLKEAGIGLIIDSLPKDHPLLEEYDVRQDGRPQKVLSCIKAREGRDKWIVPLDFDERTLTFRELT